MKKAYYRFCVACVITLCVISQALGEVAPVVQNPADPSSVNGTFRQNYDGFWPYPMIDLTKGIPPWITNWNNNTESVPLDKGAYVKSYDNVSQDGKMYYQTYTQSSTGVTIVNVKKNKNEQASSSDTTTYGISK